MAFHQYAVQRLVDRATAAGIDVPPAVAKYAFSAAHESRSGGALAWATKHPYDERLYGCCWGEVIGGGTACTCWHPVYDLEQTPPTPVARDELTVRVGGMCGDCAYRPRSPERADAYSSEALMELPSRRAPFFCHDGFRRPALWIHPDGRVVAGSRADYQPPIIGGIPYQVDGTPGLLCAGWAAILARYDSDPAF
jgi:hypothetical protein